MINAFHISWKKVANGYLVDLVGRVVDEKTFFTAWPMTNIYVFNEYSDMQKFINQQMKLADKPKESENESKSAV